MSEILSERHVSITFFFLPLQPKTSRSLQVSPVMTKTFCLGKLLGMHMSTTYISGCTDFLILFLGNREKIEINPANYKDILHHLHEIRDAAARWWYLYGKG